MKLNQSFYERHPVAVAQDLLGKTLVFKEFQGIITETEAYRGSDDEASHAFKGITPRTQIMFGAAGHSYVYLIYGIYYCFNIVTEKEGQASAVLIRGLKLPDIHLDGPGKLCKHLGITKSHQGINLISSDTMHVIDTTIPVTYQATPRIGIQKARDKHWRFLVDSPLEKI